MKQIIRELRHHLNIPDDIDQDFDQACNAGIFMGIVFLITQLLDNFVL